MLCEPPLMETYLRGDKKHTHRYGPSLYEQLTRQ